MKHLIIDVHNLCWRAYHTTGQLDNGVVFGFLRELLALKRLHSPDLISFCFDSPSSKRKNICLYYKMRAVQDQEERRKRMEVMKQIDALRFNILPDLGYRNIFFQDGYEADDLIASVCRGLKTSDTAIIVSSDQDLYQLLSDSPPIVKVWDSRTKSAFTASTFKEKYRVDVGWWVMVKCLAGCKSDNIRGIDGVGEHTAIKYINNELKPRAKILAKLEEEEEKVIADNWKLVEIPFPGTMQCKTIKDRTSSKLWEYVLKELGIKSLKEFSHV